MTDPDPARRPDPDALLARYRRTGDPEAFGDLFDATSAELHRVAVALLPDPVGAEDAVQETFLSALRSLDQFDSSRRVMPWLVGILEHRILHARRARSRRKEIAADADRPAALRDDDDARASDRAEARAAIETLEEPYRSTALLRWRYGLEPAEIAHVRGEPPGTTRSILSRALARLRRAIKAVPLVLLGAATAKSLADVREHVVREAARRVVTTAGSGSVTLALGGAVMGKKTVLALAIVLAALGVWAVWPEDPKPADDAAARAAPAAASSPDAPASGELAAARHDARTSRSAPDTHSAATLRVHVVDRAGAPVRGAVVVAYDPAERVPVALDARAATDPRRSAATSGDDGSAVLDAPRSSLTGVADVVATAPGFGAGSAHGVRPGEERRIVLPRAARIEGVVRDLAGRPLAGAVVTLHALVDGAERSTRSTADESGRYAVADVPGDVNAASVLTLVATADGFAPTILDLTNEFSGALQAGETRSLDVVLTRGARLEGVVLDADTRAAVAGATVVAWSSAGAKWAGFAPGILRESPANPHVVGRTTTGSDGRFTLDRIPSQGFHPVRSTWQSPKSMRMLLGHVAAWKPGTAVGVDEIPFPTEGETVLAEIRLRRAATVVGRLVDASGAPVAGLAVFVEEAFRSMRPVLPIAVGPAPADRTFSAADGRFVLDGVPVAAEGSSTVTLSIARVFGWSPWETAKRSVSAVAGETVDVGDVVLAPKARSIVRVRVVNDAGVPVVGARVHVPLSPGAATDADGMATATVADPPPEGTLVDVLVRAEGMAFTTIQAPVGRTAAPPPVTTARVARAHRIAGRVVTRGDGPPSRAVIVVADGRIAAKDAFGERMPGTSDPSQPVPLSEYASVAADADGRFVVEDLPPGPYHVLVVADVGSFGEDPRAGDVRVVVSDVADGASNVVATIDLPPRAPRRALDVEVVDAATEQIVPAPEATLARANRKPVVGRLVSPGRLRFEPVEDGASTLVVTDPSHVSARSTVTVGPERRAPVRVALTRGARVTGTMRFRDARRVTGGTVHLRDVLSGDARFGAVAADGRFTIEGVAPGRHRPTAMLTDGAQGEWLVPLSGVVDVNPGAAEAAIDSEWVPAGWLAVGFEDPAPAGADRVAPPDFTASAVRPGAVELRTLDGTVLERREPLIAADATSVRFAAPPQTVVVRYEAPGFASEERRVEVTPGRTVRVTFPAR